MSIQTRGHDVRGTLLQVYLTPHPPSFQPRLSPPQALVVRRHCSKVAPRTGEGETCDEAECDASPRKLCISVTSCSLVFEAPPACFVLIPEVTAISRIRFAVCRAASVPIPASLLNSATSSLLLFVVAVMIGASAPGDALLQQKTASH